MADAAGGTSTSAQESQAAAKELAQMAEQLRRLVRQFRIHDNPQPPREVAQSSKALAAGAGR